MTTQEVISNTNSKGQIVIPKKFRDKLNINEKVPLTIQLKEDGVTIKPLRKSVTSEENRKLTIEILKSTAGAWAGDNWPETEKRRRKIELAASRRRKKAW